MSEKPKRKRKKQVNDEDDLVEFMGGSGQCPKDLRRMIAAYAWSEFDVLSNAVQQIVDRYDEDDRILKIRKIKVPQTIPRFEDVLSMIADLVDHMQRLSMQRLSILDKHVRAVCQILMKTKYYAKAKVNASTVWILMNPQNIMDWNKRLKELDPNETTSRFRWTQCAKYRLVFLYSELLKSTPFHLK